MSKYFWGKNRFKILLLFFLIMVLLLVFLIGYGICFVIKDHKLDFGDNFFDTISISYVGDLKLFKEQVDCSYDVSSKKYNFDYMFEKTKKYFFNSDYTIGLLNSSFLSSNIDCSGSCYDDKKLSLEYMDSVKKSGVDFVSVSTNHFMDNGKDGVLNTINCLNKVGLNYSGLYKNAIDKSKVKFVNVKGVKIAILPYTSLPSGYDSDYFVFDNTSLANIIVPKSDKNFDKVKKMIKKDFDSAKNGNAYLILVMPYMEINNGEKDEFQSLWNDIFVSYGADIILGDYSGVDMPIMFDDDALIVDSFGKISSSYGDNDGYATIVEIYIDKKTKKVYKASVVPLYNMVIGNEKYQSVSVNDIYEGEELYNDFDVTQIKEINKINQFVVSSLIGKNVSSSYIQKRYFVYKDDDIDFDFIDVLYNSTLKGYLDDASRVTFIGDSITSGVSKNDNHGWYEPFMKFYPDVEIVNISHSGYTTKDVIEKFSSKIEESDSDIYFIALGVNDIRYRDEKKGAINGSEYIANIDKIVKLIENKNGKVVLIAPWYSLINDNVSRISFSEKMKLFDEYSSALASYSSKNDFVYIDANNYIEKFLAFHNAFDYYADYIHPNSGQGIKLYSYAVVYDSIKK